MGFFSRSTERLAEDIPVDIEMELSDAESLYRVAEQDDRVEAVIQNFKSQTEDLMNQVRMGGGSMLPADRNRHEQHAQHAVDALGAFGYQVSVSVLMELD